DIRIRYGAVSDEMSKFAKNKRIPLVTAAQMNRNGSKFIDDFRDMEKPDGLMGVQRQHVGDSSFIIDNADAVIAINREDYPERKLPARMTFKHIVARMGREDNVKYFSQDFDNLFKIATDAKPGDIPRGKEGTISSTMIQEQEQSNTVSNMAGLQTMYSSRSASTDIFANQANQQDLSQRLNMKGL